MHEPSAALCVVANHDYANHAYVTHIFTRREADDMSGSKKMRAVSKAQVDAIMGHNFIPKLSAIGNLVEA